MGAIFGRDQKAYDRWRRSSRKTAPVLSGQALEAAVMHLARSNPEYVIVEPA